MYSFSYMFWDYSFPQHSTHNQVRDTFESRVDDDDDDNKMCRRRRKTITTHHRLPAYRQPFNDTMPLSQILFGDALISRVQFATRKYLDKYI